jgi:hypothetical protein
MAVQVEGPERLDREIGVDTDHGTERAPKHARVGISRSRIVDQIYTCRWAPVMARAACLASTVGLFGHKKFWRTLPIHDINGG